ncbi:MAG: 3-hydroxyacyl-CoA dehydrogenase NAD-binding domain-containing protein, partial [Winogradskyella arenosi]
MKNIAVIGAGTMGNGIAHTFAQSGFKVQLIDLNDASLKRGMDTIARNLDRMVDKEKISAADKAETLGNITTFTDTQEGVKNVDLVVEAATENLDLKLKIFKQLDEVCEAHTILATNTSSISITQIAAATSRPEQVIGMHFMNPVPIMKLVEIIRGYNTSDAVTTSIMELSKTLGKVPTEVNDYPGFAANRILMPMINESIETLYNGVAGVEEIDTVMK